MASIVVKIPIRKRPLRVAPMIVRGPVGAPGGGRPCVVEAATGAHRRDSLGK